MPLVRAMKLESGLSDAAPVSGGQMRSMAHPAGRRPSSQGPSRRGPKGGKLCPPAAGNPPASSGAGVWQSLHQLPQIDSALGESRPLA